MKNFKFESPKNIIESGYAETEKFKAEILPIIKILKPDEISLDEHGNKVDYEKEVEKDLFESVKKLQVERGILYESPDKTIGEAKDLLNSRIKLLLNDVRDLLTLRIKFLFSDAKPFNLKKKPSLESVKKARIALLVQDDLTDFRKWSRKDPLDNKIRELRDYIVGREDGARFTESDIDLLMQTKYKKVLTDSGDTSDYISKSYGSCESIPKSLMIGLAQSEASSRGYPIGYGLEEAQKGKYDNECLEQLLACGFTENALQNFNKFQGKPLEKLFKSGIPNEREAVNLLLELKLPKEEFEKYFDIIIKHNVGDEIVRRQGGSNDKELESVIFKYEDTINKMYEIKSSQKVNDSEHLKVVKDAINKGEIGIILAISKVREYVKAYAETDYSNFIINVSKYDQEHLVFDYLKDEDKINYADKLIEQGEEYQIIKLHGLFKEHSLGLDIYNKIKDKNMVDALKGQLVQFKDLPQAEALNFIDRDRTDIFLKNIESFNFPPEFLQTEKVQEACFSEFNKEIMTYKPAKAGVISDRIHFPKEKLNQAILKAVKTKWIDKDRNDWARWTIMEFPEIKEFLNNPEDKERAFRDLKKQLESGYAGYVAEILECFPIEQEQLKLEETTGLAISLIRRELSTAGGYGRDYFNDIEKIFESTAKIAKYIDLPDYISDLQLIFGEIETSPATLIDIRREIFQMLVTSEKPRELYGKIPLLLEEINKNKKISSDKHLVLAYISKFINGGTEAEKKGFFEKISKDIESIAKNVPADFVDSMEYYKYILQQVYPSRNYDTYKNINEYKDRSKDLDKYSFNKNGYDLKLSGVVGYKLKEDAINDVKLIDEFSSRIQSIKSIASHEKILNFLNENIEASKAESIEGKILEYFKQKGYSVETMNVLLAYQLLGRYDDFVSGSEDRVSLEEGTISKNYILLDELVNQYGDNMKETMKSIQEKVSICKDREIFASNFIEKYEKKYNEAFILIETDLQKIPRDKITDQVIQKKILKTIKNTFQGLDNIQGRAEYFSSLFSLNDLDNFSEIWHKHINELFVVDENNNIDISKVESLQSSVFTRLQNEINKYEEIKEIDETKNEAKLKKERVIKGYFSKNRENAHARMVADVCLANDPNMLKSEKYFEFVLFDEERNKCMGTCMLLQMDEPEDGKKYLLYCPNPSVGLVSEVSAKKLYQLISKQITTFAENNNFDGVLVNKSHGHSTNRAGLFQQSLDHSCLKDKTGKEILMNLVHNHILSNNYSYQNNLQVIWEKDNLVN